MVLFLFKWLSPEGCALFSFQLHIPLKSSLGQRLPILQHLVSVAIVNSITKHDEYKVKKRRLEQTNNLQKKNHFYLIDGKEIVHSFK